MLESLPRVRNFYWADEQFQPTLEVQNRADLTTTLARLRGQFALAWSGPDRTLMLARDPLGSNKLFFAIEGLSTVVAANYLADLVDRGLPFEAVYSVPAGHFVCVDLDRRTLSLQRYFDLRERQPEMDVRRAAENIRRQLEVWFSRLAAQFRHRKICVSLSGGLDSSLIAALAVRCFPDVTAYTYGFAAPNGRESEDVRYARRVADFLKVPLRLVSATADDVQQVLDDALCYGQDWRDFNVHCAIVNEILARAIRADAEAAGAPELPLVLTGDLANELCADYSPLSYAGREIYRLPRVGPRRLRTALIQGLDAGDREVGIFNHHGIDVIQPYGLAVDAYLQVPGSFARAGFKQTLVREIGADLLPSFLFDRRKVRAQVGDPVGPGGLISTLLDAGRDARWLKAAFARRFGVEADTPLQTFIRLGRYRSAARFPQEVPIYS